MMSSLVEEGVDVVTENGMEAGCCVRDRGGEEGDS